MSKAADRALEANMGRRRPREMIREEVADSILGEMVPAGVVDIPVTALYRSPFQVRVMGTDEEIDKLAESIQSSGLISPVVVRPIRNPQEDLHVKSLPGFPVGEAVAGEAPKDLHVKSFEIVTGHHRVLACIKLGWTSVPVVMKSMTDAEAAIALTADNAIKKDLTDWDRYQHILMLERTGACRTGREIAATLGVSPAQISQIRAFDKLPAATLHVIAGNPGIIGYRLAYELVNSGLSESQPEFVTEAISRLAVDKLKAQSAVIPWIHQQTTVRAPKMFRREVRIQRPGSQTVRVVVTEQGASIYAKDIDPEKLSSLIENNLSSLFSSV
ncbi:MAG: ParB/RepB/Spo0J family partition protein [Bacteroidota bacterium]